MACQHLMAVRLTRLHTLHSRWSTPVPSRFWRLFVPSWVQCLSTIHLFWSLVLPCNKYDVGGKVEQLHSPSMVALAQHWRRRTRADVLQAKKGEVLTTGGISHYFVHAAAPAPGLQAAARARAAATCTSRLPTTTYAAAWGTLWCPRRASVTSYDASIQTAAASLSAACICIAANCLTAASPCICTTARPNSTTCPNI